MTWVAVQVLLNTMKMLLALIGYLAVTALRFRPFAFASPLADYDVNKNHFMIGGVTMKHVLDSMQKHGDSALMKRASVPGHIVEARQEEGLVSPETVIVSLVFVVIDLSIVWIAHDDPVGGNDAGFLVDLFV